MYISKKKNIKDHEKIWKNLPGEILWKFQTAAHLATTSEISPTRVIYWTNSKWNPYIFVFYLILGV